jgi:glycosyltransferase involved in cell wall biosynthesis
MRVPRWLQTRVLSVGPLPPEWGGSLRGGVTRAHASLIEELSGDRGPRRVRACGVLVPPPHEIDKDGANLCPVRVFKPGRRFRWHYGRALAKSQPHVVVFHNIAAFAAARSTRVHAGLAPELPAVGIVHAWHPITMKRDAEQARRNRRRTEQALARLQAAVFVSHHCKREGEDLGLVYPPIAEVIHYPLQPAFAGSDAEFGDRDRRGIAFLGSFNPRKNPASLIEAVARRTRLELTLAGRGRQRGELEELIGRLGVSDRVRFAPYVPPPGHLDAIWELLLASEALCLPSRSESFGIVMIEALAAGTPVVGFGPTFEEIREQLGTECGEPIWDGSPEEIAAALDRVLAREWDRTELRRRAVAAFSPAAIAKRYARLLRKVT